MSFHWHNQESFCRRRSPAGKPTIMPAPNRRHDGVDTRQTVAIRLANDGSQRNLASMLINRMYSWRGYGNNHQLPDQPTHTTFTASRGPETVGTITLAVDSQKGLAADAIFKDEIDRFRCRPGAHVCELTKLAFDSSSPSKPLLASIFHLVFIYGQRKYACTDLFIEVNPRHVRFYEAMLGFQTVGELKVNDSVRAPSRLMRLEVASIREHINLSARQEGRLATRSLYQYFFSSDEEDGIFLRLVANEADILV